MTAVRIVNASPLVTLAKVDLHDLLEIGTETVLIPDAVAAEIASGPADDPARRLLATGFGGRLPPSPVPDSVLEWGLGAGESAVIAESLRLPSGEAVLDGAAARRCARLHGIAFVGTLGIVVRARRIGRIPAAATVFTSLRSVGLHFSDELARSVLETIGEEWPIASD